MEFACSHVVCNWRPELLDTESTCVSPCLSVTEHEYDNRANLLPAGSAPPPRECPPLPPRKRTSKKIPRPTLPPPPIPSLLTASLPPPPLPSIPLPPPPSLPPPLPPRGQRESRLKANVNVISLSIGHLVDVNASSALNSTQDPVYCGKCSAALSTFSSLQNTQDTVVWVCEFCGSETSLSGVRGRGLCRVPRGGDVLYRSFLKEADYQNLEVLVVFCLDVSGSMCVTSEVNPGNSMRSPTHVSRLQSMEDALQRVLSSLLQTSPHHRVALVTFNDEVVVYGDGSGSPVSLREGALLDCDFLWQQGQQFPPPHSLAQSFQHLTHRLQHLREHGATALGPAALVSVAMASRYQGSKVILCTDGRANIGLGDLEQSPASSCSLTSSFYTQLARQAANSGVIVSVMTFEGTDCRLAEVGRLADETGGRVNIVNISTMATEIHSVLSDNILATGVTVTLLAADGMYFPYEEQRAHVLVKEVGNVTEGQEVTFQFAIRPERVEEFQQRDIVPFQLQLSFRTRQQQQVTRILTQQRRVTTSSWVWPGSLNVGVLGVHCAQLSSRLTMQGRLQEAQSLLATQQQLLQSISERSHVPQEESIYGNWISTMTTICDDLTTMQSEEDKNLQASQTVTLSDEAAKVFYQMKRATSVGQKTGRRQTDMLAQGGTRSGHLGSGLARRCVDCVESHSD